MLHHINDNQGRGPVAES